MVKRVETENYYAVKESQLWWYYSKKDNKPIGFSNRKDVIVKAMKARERKG